MTSESSPHGGVEVRDDDGVTAVRLWGDVDVAVRVGGTAPLGGLRDGTSPITVDCRDVDFMDSTGMSILVRVLRDAAADGRSVRFLGASEPVRRLLEVTGAAQWMAGLGVDLPR
jgi:anti-anti-sigma factor